MVHKLVFIIGFLLIFFIVDAQTNYSNLYNWAAHPCKKDFGDSVPKPLKSSVIADSSVDVFFIHPTTYTNVAKEFGQNAIIENDELNNTTDATAILYQATIFNAAGRLFAPRYRQAHLSSYYPITNEDSIAAINAFDTAYADVKAAFEYYLKHL